MTIHEGRVSSAPSGTGFLLEFDELYDTHPEDLWEAVTAPERLARWMVPYRGDFRLGGRWEAIGSDGGVYCVGEITSCDPPNGFSTSWQVQGEPRSELTVRLRAEGRRTRLSLRHEGVTDVDYGAGWHAYLEALSAHLADPSGDHAEGEAWQRRFAEMAPTYALRFDAARH
ncbi:SRPBCC domain-containing protein [Agromyces bauzanensis]|uniref:Activator of Hsp90 ATPase homologue 1/2-like C-terminal domain-containing protein n=1 Tax=Agromyces bauzanensis TaxID=1308924 RepID=A0A917PUD1_9MICO|nr:SRPBCC domain-containing protein [Agromyces bauzanensis]GGJ92979.1 hypothetical protein GCM10011372_34390 [Agromyces bauzanensis]